MLVKRLSLKEKCLTYTFDAIPLIQKTHERVMFSDIFFISVNCFASIFP